MQTFTPWHNAMLMNYVTFKNICHHFSVHATNVTMVEYPNGMVPENATINITCVTDAGNPTPQVCLYLIPCYIEMIL